jgi:hypothetical protein
VVIQIDIHPAGEEHDQHIVRMTPGVSRMTTIRKVPIKSKSGPCSWDEVLAHSDARPGHHHGLPHSPFNKPPRNREVQLDEVVNRLLGLSAPIKPDMQLVQIKAYHRSQNNAVLN